MSDVEKSKPEMTRVHRWGQEAVPKSEMPALGPEDRDWYTLEIDIIPPDSNGNHSMYRGNIINRHTGETRTYEARVEDYLEFYSNSLVSPERRAELAHGEAVGTLMQVIRDSFDEDRP